jgi:hypothetical protein
MNRITLVAGAAAAAAFMLTGAPAANAAAPTTFTITQTIDTNTPGDDPPLTTFTSSIPGCETGTFYDDVQVAAGNVDRPGQRNFIITTDYVCDSGDVITALKQVHLGRDGQLQLTGGTGRFAGIHGTGTDRVVSDVDGVITTVISGLLVG